MAMAVGRDDNESRTSAINRDPSSSDRSDHEEDEIATISDVFSDMLIANENLLHAAAQYQLENDVPSIMAYQRILHRNLVEMADFVDSVFGVYNKMGSSEVNEEEEENEDTIPTDAASRDDQAIESSTTSKREPERMRSLLIDRFRLENKRRMEQRTARLWRKMRRRVRVEEGVTTVMTQAAERIAQITVSVATARIPPPEQANQLPVAASPTQLASSVTTPTTTQPSDPPQQQPSEQQSPPKLVDAASNNPPPSPVPTASATSKSTPLETAQPQPAVTMSLLAPQPTGAMLVPLGSGTFTKVPLPPMSSGLSMLFTHMSSVNHMSSVCEDCVALNRTAHECRSVLKHMTPAPVTAHPVMLPTPSMWPLAFNSVVTAPAPVRSVLPMRTGSSSTSTFKKMCEECKKTHKSVHHCRKILGHTTPEWDAGLPDTDPKPRKRRSRKKKGMESIAATPVSSPSESTPVTSSAADMAANEI